MRNQKSEIGFSGATADDPLFVHLASYNSLTLQAVAGFFGIIEIISVEPFRN